jgi:putative MATE family efflux protein
MAMQDLTGGPVRGHLLRMSGFMLVTMIVQTLYGIVDLLWVGRLGPEAVAAVALGSNLMMVVMSVGQVLSVGAAALVAQAMGRKDPPAVRALFNQALLLALLLGAVFGLLFFLGRRLYAEALAGDRHTAGLLIEFLGWFVPSLALQIPSMVLSAALRGVGNVRISTLTQIGTVLLNIVLAPILIFGWGTGVKLGVGGAGLATLLSVAIGFAVMLAHVLRSGQFFGREPGAWKPQTALWKRMVGIGLPSGLEFGLMGLYLVSVMALLRAFGPQPQAAFGIGMRILQMGMMPSMAVSFATAAIIGQNFGARRHDRVAEAWWLALRWSLGGCLIFVIAFHLVPEALFRPFTDDAAVVAHGAEFLRWISWNLLASAVVFACSGMFSGLGNTRPLLISSAIRITAILLPAMLLSRHADFAPGWIWRLSVVATALQAALNLLFLKARLKGSSRDAAAI